MILGLTCRFVMTFTLESLSSQADGAFVIESSKVEYRSGPPYRKNA